MAQEGSRALPDDRADRRLHPTGSGSPETETR
jgi:hypothetical protein